MSGFQTKTTVQPAIGVEGDFASGNPRFAVIAGAGAFVAGLSGVTIGRFCWSDPRNVDDVGGPANVNSFGSGPVLGFVHRDMQALLTAYLQESSLTIPSGFPVTVHSGGDFLVKNRGTTEAVIGNKAYAAFADGSISFAPTGSPTGGGTSTASTIAAGTNAFTGSIAGDVMTVTAVGSGTLYNGTQVSGTNVVAGTAIVEQLLPLLAGEALRGVGRYAVSVPDQTVASEALTGTYGLLTIGGTVAGNYAVGQPVSGGGTSAGTTITDVGTGTGGAGTYIVNNTQTVGSGALNTASNVETKWFAMSPGIAGDLIKISDHPLG
jgi:hypothetical protein